MAESSEWDDCPCPGCTTWLIEAEYGCYTCQIIEEMNEEKAESEFYRDYGGYC